MGSLNSPLMTRSVDSSSDALFAPLTADTEWQKKHVTPWYWEGKLATFRPSVVKPSRTAMGAWHCTQNEPSAPCVSRWPRAFIARKTGSLAAAACMLNDQSAK